MRSPRRTDIAIATAAAALAVAVPVLAWSHLDRRVDRDLVPRLSTALAEHVRVGRLEVGLLGALTLDDMRIGDRVSVRQVDIRMDLESALGGRARVHEIRLSGVDAHDTIGLDGSSELSLLADRLRHMAGGHGSSGSDAAAADVDEMRAGDEILDPGPEFTMTDASLTADIADLGRVHVTDLSVRGRLGDPILRMRASRVHVEAQRGAASIRGALHRVAADIDTRSRRIERAVAVDGELAIEEPGAGTLRLVDVSITRGLPSLQPDGPRLRLDARVRSDPAAREPGARLTLELDRHGVQVRGHELPLWPARPWSPRSIDLSSARFSGVARFESLVSGTDLDMEIEGQVRDLVVHDSRVARRPVPLSGLLHTRVKTWRDASAAHGSGHSSRRLAVETLSWQMDGLRVQAEGAAEYVRAPRPADAIHPVESAGARATWIPDRASFAFTLAETRCATALQSMPEAFRDRLLGLDLSGSMSARLELEFSRQVVDDTRLALDVDVDGCRTLRDAPDADPRTLTAPARALATAGTAGFVPLQRLPRHLSRAFVAMEDARFFRHTGFDPGQIERSLAVDLEAGSFVRGGSTITQQLVKNAFLSHERTLSRKFQEAVLTWRVEAVASKEEILERYLNIIELGPDTRGVDAAARYWFGKPATELGVRESAFLVALTPAPGTTSRRILAHGDVDEEISARIDKVLAVMRAHGVISEGIYQKALRFQLELVMARDAAPGLDAVSQKPVRSDNPVGPLASHRVPGSNAQEEAVAEVALEL